ncbi:MAG: hypothetical protein IIB53_10735, partial [Planctomycetes bacterium]|nr:hypothetical protein [Planctomycetota bacterium]
YLWNSGAGLGQSLGFRVIIYADDAPGGGPGSVISDQTVALGSEFLTGVEYFGRPEVVFSVDIAPVALDADTTYWVAMQPQGIENGFQLTSGIDNLIGDQVWVLYPDLSGPDYVPGSDIFGAFYDASFSLQGEVIPAPGAMALLAFAGLVGARRRRRK